MCSFRILAGAAVSLIFADYVMPSVEPWGVRYLEYGALAAQAVLVQHCSTRGGDKWAAVLPDKSCQIVSIYSKGNVRALPRDGVVYVPLPNNWKQDPTWFGYATRVLVRPDTVLFCTMRRWTARRSSSESSPIWLTRSQPSASRGLCTVS